MSDSSTFLSLPSWFSSSCWAIFKTTGWLTRKAKAHFRVAVVVLLPSLLNLSCGAIRMRNCMTIIKPSIMTN
ncbi:hypothetical protein HanXRQr2_Chr07g0311621 [Helianthus annuus]|uniref:Uncharacterized protein n=1 Tax=Helianthus annuus TaxID=4232 RepID=A0A9K3INX9_HELAN|nr:hypothetical protein HanXRQr2_Chr07g0311621 [Helianthus annuus]